MGYTWALKGLSHHYVGSMYSIYHKATRICWEVWSGGAVGRLLSQTAVCPETPNHVKAKLLRTTYMTSYGPYILTMYHSQNPGRKAVAASHAHPVAARRPNTCRTTVWTSVPSDHRFLIPCSDPAPLKTWMVGPSRLPHRSSTCKQHSLPHASRT